ncbi:MAG: cation transporter [Saprospiraceae bacterium]|nr:cation transporter [Saprospiraceae bacterium]
MGHHHHDHHHHHTDEKNLSIAFFLNLVFTIIEFIGGLYTNSIAILSDALHDLGDSFSLGLAWYFQKLSKKKGDQEYSYGYKRFSLLGAIINSIVLVVGSIFIIIESIKRFQAPQETDAQGMMFLAILGIVFNGLAAWKLHGGYSHNEKVISLHLLEDILGWVAVLIGSIIIYFTDYYRIDSILSFAISLFILTRVLKSLKSTMEVVLQKFPENIDRKNVIDFLESNNKIGSYHDMHIWSMDGQYNVMTIHVVLINADSDIDRTSLKSELRSGLKKLGIDHATIEMEEAGEECIFEKDAC